MRMSRTTTPAGKKVEGVVPLSILQNFPPVLFLPIPFRSNPKGIYDNFRQVYYFFMWIKGKTILYIKGGRLIPRHLTPEREKKKKIIIIISKINISLTFYRLFAFPFMYSRRYFVMIFRSEVCCEIIVQIFRVLQF